MTAGSFFFCNCNDNTAIMRDNFIDFFFEALIVFDLVGRPKFLLSLTSSRSPGNLFAIPREPLVPLNYSSTWQTLIVVHEFIRKLSFGHFISLRKCKFARFSHLID